jgi:glutamyl-tRNA synthetase
LFDFMENKTIRTRFAPSPTGMVHLGSLRTTLFGWLWARKHGGEFIIRLEDTDRARLVEGAKEQMLSSIKALGMDWDFGPDKPGPFGSCIQSERLMTYQDAIQTLLKSGVAYRDWRTSEELDAMRQQAQAEKRAFVYKKHMAKLEGDITAPCVIRIAIPADIQLIWEDAVKGLQTWSSNDVDDFVAIKGDGFPTYHFANVVDDHAMEITHVIRADEWLASTPKHLFLWDAFGWERPVFAHVPAVLSPDGKKKLSKRDGAKAVSEYLAEGYMPEALMNFLALIGWNDGTEKECYSPAELINAFELSRVQKSPARFDDVKLEWMNGVHIRAMNIENLYEHSAGWWHPASENYPKEYKQRVLQLNQERLKKFSELSELSWYFFKDPSATEELKSIMLSESGLEQSIAHGFLERVIQTCEAIEFSEQTLHDSIYGLCEPLATKPAILFKLIRIALVGGKNAPGLFETMATLGKETSLRRLHTALELLHN